MNSRKDTPLLAARVQLSALLAAGEANAASSSKAKLDEIRVSHQRFKSTRNPQIISALALCTCVAMLAPELALADPRDIAGPSELQTPEMIEARREQMAEDMAEWLPRLVGRYRLEGQEVRITNFPTDPRIPPPPPKFVRGKADCVQVGSGPGVQCVIHVEWDRSTSWSSAWLNSSSPAMMLYGLDSLAGKIRYLQVDHHSIAQQGEAVLTGDTLKFHEHPVNQRRRIGSSMHVFHAVCSDNGSYVGPAAVALWPRPANRRA